MGTPVYVRTMEEYADLVRPWKADANGFIPLLEWHGIDRSEMNETDSDMFGSAGAGYGSYLVK